MPDGVGGPVMTDGGGGSVGGGVVWLTLDKNLNCHDIYITDRVQPTFPKVKKFQLSCEMLGT